MVIAGYTSFVNEILPYLMVASGISFVLGVFLFVAGIKSEDDKLIGFSMFLLLTPAFVACVKLALVVSPAVGAVVFGMLNAFIFLFLPFEGDASSEESKKK